MKQYSKIKNWPPRTEKSLPNCNEVPCLMFGIHSQAEKLYFQRVIKVFIGIRKEVLLKHSVGFSNVFMKHPRALRLPVLSFPVEFCHFVV
jgi:hypothetical protein